MRKKRRPTGYLKGNNKKVKDLSHGRVDALNRASFDRIDKIIAEKEMYRCEGRYYSYSY